MVKSPPNHTSLPSTVATFLTTCLMAVLQPSGYSVFHSGDTPIQLSLPWWSYSCQCLNTETLSISYTIHLYIRLVVTLWSTSLIIDEDNSYWTWSPVFNGDTPISTHFHLRLLPIIWSCDHVADRWHSILAKAKVIPQVCSSLSPFYRLPPQCEPCLTYHLQTTSYEL